jgi:hypothetical protein
MKAMPTAARFKYVVLGWAGASLFFTAFLMVSDLGGHKPFGFALYTNAVHYALWALALPLLSRATRSFPLRGKPNLERGCVVAIGRGARDIGNVGPVDMVVTRSAGFFGCIDPAGRKKK